MEEELRANIGRLHTTALGVERVRRNLCLAASQDVVAWCKEQVLAPGSGMIRKGKNWYVQAKGIEITINARSYTIITAHRVSPGNQ